MNSHNILNTIDVRRVNNAAAAGTSAINTTVVDMLGYETVAFVALFGTLTASQVTGIKVQQGTASDASDMADLAGTASTAMADGDSNKMLLTEVYRPTERYVRLVVTRGTANAVLDGAIALLGRAGVSPPAFGSTVSNATTVEIFNSPAEGTA